MARETDVVPDLYFPGDEGEIQDSITGDRGHHCQVEGLEGGDPVDLTEEGFIPIHKLTLEDLPESIRTQENLELILDFAKRVVRINNNKLSDKRPDDDEFKMRKQKSLTGSGYIWSCDNNSVTIITNRHVLFNAEELKKSTFDIFHNSGPRDYKRCRRGDGDYLLGKCSKYDLVLAEYKPKEEMISHIKEHWPAHAKLPRQWKFTQRHAPTHGASMVPIVCLISHPLGQPKQVSFGEMVDFNVHKKTLHYDAPSKPGSSGAPLLVFTNPEAAAYDELTYVYHVGTGLKSGRRIAHVDYVDLSFLDREDSIAMVLKEGSEIERDEDETDEMPEIARTSLEVIALASYVPLFGDYHLQFQKAHLADMDPSLVKPCKDFQKRDISAAILRHPQVKEIACSIAQTVPCFALRLSSNPKYVSDLVSLLESEGPCFCRSIVKMMERGVRSETNTATECCLSPSRAAAKMSKDDDVTWPWLNGSNTSCISEPEEEEECLLPTCLKLCAFTIPVALLHMIVKANASIQQLLPQHCDASFTTFGDENGSWQFLHSRQGRDPPDEQKEDIQPDDAVSPRRRGRLDPEMASSDENWLLLAKDVLLLSEEAVKLNLLNFAAQHFDSSNGEAPRQEEEGSEFSRCLARSEHMVQHERQVHPDMENAGRGEHCGEKCQCGRPVVSETLAALHFLKGYVANAIDCEDVAPIEEITTGSQEDVDFDIARFFLSFLYQTEESGRKGSALLAYLDEVGHFPKGRHSVLLYLASIESLLYNCRLLATSISHDILPFYCAFPASMFGRPGNWPGNVTPPEVRRTAWRLIEDAIKASGLPPAVLADLERNKARREKLVDVYVDMKHLKWKRLIQPEEFDKWLFEFRKRRITCFENLAVFPNATAYFVVSVYFTLYPEIVAF